MARLVVCRPAWHMSKPPPQLSPINKQSLSNKRWRSVRMVSMAQRYTRHHTTRFATAALQPGATPHEARSSGARPGLCLYSNNPPIRNDCTPPCSIYAHAFPLLHPTHTHPNQSIQPHTFEAATLFDVFKLGHIPNEFNQSRTSSCSLVCARSSCAPHPCESCRTRSRAAQEI